MAHHDLADGPARVAEGDYRGDILVREAMESVAAHAGLVQVGGYREALREVGVGRVKRRVETGDLRQTRPPFEQKRDWRQVVGLVQRRQRNESLQRLEDIAVDENRPRESGSAVHHPVSDRLELDALALFPDELRQMLDRAVVTEIELRVPGSVSEHVAL